jgi:hypothetical protein
MAFPGEGEGVEDLKQVPSLFELPDADQEALRRRVEKWDGVARVFVHPFFDVGERGMHPYGAAEGGKFLASQREGITKMLERNPEDTPPIFVFEEQWRLGGVGPRYAAMKNAPYIIPTSEDRPDPILPEVGDTFRDLTDTQKAWDGLSKVLVGLGVKKLLIGGTYLRIDPDVYEGDGRDPEHISEQLDKMKAYFEMIARERGVDPRFYSHYIFGCVGEAAKQLAAKFNVVISNLSFPMKGHQIRGVERRK